MRRKESIGGSQSPAGIPKKSSSRSKEKLDQYRQHYGGGGSGRAPLPDTGGEIPLHPDAEEVLQEVKLNWPFMQQAEVRLHYLFKKYYVLVSA
jgi:hypothetical protein